MGWGLPAERGSRESVAINDIRHMNVYDGVRCCRDRNPFMTNGMKLFGNANVGDFSFTNLMLPGYLDNGETPTVVQRWYARTDLPSTSVASAAFHEWAHSAQATFVMGNWPLWKLSVAELLDRRPRADRDAVVDPWPIVVPTRQYVSVQIDYSEVKLDRLVGILESEYGEYVDSVGGNPKLWIHVEGLSRVTQPVLDAITKASQKRRSVEDSVAAWILGLADEKCDGDVKAQLQAVADGVLERRHER